MSVDAGSELSLPGERPTGKAGSRPPIDPRLWRYSAAARGYLVLTVGLSVVNVAMVVISALALGRILAGIIVDEVTDVRRWTTELSVLLLAMGVRVLGTWLQSRFAHRAASRVVAELKGEVLGVAARIRPRDLDVRRDEIATVLTRGIDGLLPYLTGYLPALVLAATLTPATLAVIAFQDLTSAAIIFVTLPLIPIFMILIGLLTRGKAAKTLTAMTALSSQLLDLLAGLPTLRALGREQGPAARVRELGHAHRRTAMSALRVAFLSSMVLELLATLCVALVAVSIGLRLVYGEMSLEAGIVALILAPEVYLPLRMVGTRFHAAEDGMAAADRAFAVIDTELPGNGGGIGRIDARGASIEFDGVSVQSRRGMAPHALSGVLEPARVTALTGPNGSGKSTAVQVLLALTDADAGEVRVAGTPVPQLDRTAWWAQVAWLPQRPVLVPGTLEENLRLIGDVVDIEEACAATGFDAVLAELPDGWATRVGAGGAGLSLGQRQRLALTRVLATRRPVLILDEPTAHLDDRSEDTVLHSLRRLAAAGKTVVVIAHRASVLAAADSVIEVRADVE
ncbi:MULTISPECIES: thiol reductant ABC exporter subunit CydD [Rhodococcus]|uniref:Thiol reductant ABC exporter subunit CydD n=1 Tax=Rhodococcus oxybenzonivorans TaxID=1990687 RepID=A0AAE4V1F8_9NOCA|nr:MULTISPECIES: thiol reductant ABC exporter subunit CydD [Rhodococcus]MDV7240864.1 thiol reductant ABC exporter subunit CydD [Rhodococcus oxybenzonivorans]MDV7266740.1 thiol reductant ABC exporter subunit CydD [Rhodococcus oxybenzonivorans]MDV7273137.1 thiol reductant ABC exporter subunit CydD [Rhodococcus oxybenzonivorans]MDV7333125.1 thiol reductant ABC exporter subunit CydD [Rhodococcus oxybenzonivorans]MDV7342291.1 thiol reductant ABC exporter subunit CydD [Rhodococcus oxybenzonivorans]